MNKYYALPNLCISTSLSQFCNYVRNENSKSLLEKELRRRLTSNKKYIFVMIRALLKSLSI